MPEITVKGMSCQHCVGSVTSALNALEGISNVQIDLGSGKVTFDQAGEVAAETIKKAIDAIGFEVVS